MRRTFLLWLLLLLVAVFTVTGAMVYVHLREHMNERAVQLVSTKLSGLMDLLLCESEHVQRAQRDSEEAALQRARALDELLSRDSALLNNHEKLQEMGNLLGAEQIVVTDGKGMIVHAVPQLSEGKRLEDCGPLRDFAVCDSGEQAELCSSPPSGKADALQYAGKHRRYAAGAVLLGFRRAVSQEKPTEETLTKLAESHRIGDNGYIALFRGGKLLNRGSLPFNASELLALPNEQVYSLDLADTTYFAYALGDMPYKLVALVPQSTVLQSGFHSLRALLLSNFLLFLAMFAAVSLLLQRYVIAGLSTVIESLRRIAAGDLDERVEVATTPEFQRLSSDINAMVDTLRFFGESEREDMNRELELARSIQSAALPSQFPAFPMRPEFDLYATCVPAMTVGGDFYDFFMPNEERLNFLVADISANGVAAALYMMRCMSLIRSIARTGAKPETLARQVNTALCEGQTAGFHLTLFYGSLNINTGELRFISAGAPQALIRHAGKAYERLPMESGPALGLSEDAKVPSCRMVLQPEDRLFFYTEGVTNATDAGNTPFGNARLHEALSKVVGDAAEDARTVLSTLRSYVGSAELQEDMTMLVLEYRGRKHSRGEMTLSANAPDGVNELLSEHLEAVFAAPADIADIQATCTAVLQALPAESKVKLEIDSTETESTLKLTYQPPRFNPLLSLPHLPMEKVLYTYDEEAGNCLTLTRQLV